MSCVVPGCKSGYGSSRLPDGVRSHVFPKDPVKRATWVEAIPRKNWKPGQSAIICSLHFAESEFKTERQV